MAPYLDPAGTDPCDDGADLPAQSDVSGLISGRSRGSGAASGGAADAGGGMDEGGSKHVKEVLTLPGFGVA